MQVRDVFEDAVYPVCPLIGFCNSIRRYIHSVDI